MIRWHVQPDVIRSKKTVFSDRSIVILTSPWWQTDHSSSLRKEKKNCIFGKILYWSKNHLYFSSTALPLHLIENFRLHRPKICTGPVDWRSNEPSIYQNGDRSSGTLEKTASMILNRLEKRACSYVITLLRLLFALNWWVIDCPLWFGVSKLKKSSSEMAMSFEFWDALCTAWPELKRCLCWIKPCWFHSFRMSSVGMSTQPLTHTLQTHSEGIWHSVGAREASLTRSPSSFRVHSLISGVCLSLNCTWFVLVCP